MNYSQISLGVLEFLKAAEGKYIGLERLRIQELVESIAKDDPSVTPRLVLMAVEELKNAGFLTAELTRSGLARSADNVSLHGFEINGSALRFLESVETLAKKEGKTRALAWSVVEKAASATVDQLVAVAAKAVNGLLGIG